MTEETPVNETTPAPQPAPQKTGQGIPAWAVISGAAAAGLVVVAGIGGYAIGQANASTPGRDLAQIAAEGPGRPDAPMPPGAAENRGERDDPDRAHDDDEWGQDGPHGDMGPQGGMRPDQLGPQSISPQDLQRLLELLMRSGAGRMPFDGQLDGRMDGRIDGRMDGQMDGQWGSPHGWSQGS